MDASDSNSGLDKTYIPSSKAHNLTDSEYSSDAQETTKKDRKQKKKFERVVEKHLKNKQRTKFPKQQEEMVYKKSSSTSVDFETDKANSAATISTINESIKETLTRNARFRTEETIIDALLTKKLLRESKYKDMVTAHLKLN
jgi:flagellar motor protein MotB